MDSVDEDLSARILLKNVLHAEPPRSPVTRSRASNAQPSVSCTRHSTRLRRSEAGALTPQEALRHSMKEKLRKSTSRVSLPPSKRRTLSSVVSKGNIPTPTAVSLLYHDEDITPRHLLRGILQTEPETSLLIQDQPIKELVLPSADSSLNSNRPSTGLSGLDLPDVTMMDPCNPVKALSRKRPRRSLNVTAFERHLGDGGDQEDVKSAEDLSSLSSTSLNSVTLSLKTPFVDKRPEIRGLQRKVEHQQKINVEEFDAAVESRGRGGHPDVCVGLESHCEAAEIGFSLHLSDVNEPDLTSDIISSTELYAQPATVGETFILTQDKDAVNATQIQKDLDGVGDKQEGELESMEMELEERTERLSGETRQSGGLLRPEGTASQTAQVDFLTGEEDAVRSQTGVEGEREAAGKSQISEEHDPAKSQTEEMADTQTGGEEEEETESQTGEEEAESQTGEEEAESLAGEEEVESLAGEEEVESQAGEEEAESQAGEEEVESQAGEEEAESLAGEEEVESLAGEEEAESLAGEEEAESQAGEEEVESQTGEEEAESLAGEEEVESQAGEEEAESLAGEEEAESQAGEEEAESQAGEEKAESLAGEEEAESLAGEEEEAESQTGEEEAESLAGEEEEAESQTGEEKAECDLVDSGKQVSEHFIRRAFRSEGGAKLPVMMEGGRGYRSMEGTLHRTDSGGAGQRAEGDLPSGPGASDSADLHTVTLGSVSPTPDTLGNEAEQGLHNEAENSPAHVDEDCMHPLDMIAEPEYHTSDRDSSPLHPQSQEEEEEEEEEEEGQEEEGEDGNKSEELSMKTPAFVRERRKAPSLDTLPTPTAFRESQQSGSVGVKPKAARKTRKKQAASATNSGLPKSYIMSVFKHFAKTKVSADVYPVLKEIMDCYFDRLSEDLETFAAHAKRKTIEVEDVELLLRRQGFVTKATPVNVLIEKYLPMEYRKLLIPVATSGNHVIPKQKR